MKQWLVSKNIILSWVITSAFFMHAAQEWHGSFVNNVSDEDLAITNNVHLPQGGTVIEAINRNVNVTLSRDAIVKANDNGPSELYLRPAAGHTITFRINHDLDFNGTRNNAQAPLLIVQSGGGQVIWEQEGGNTLSFTSNSGSGGVQYYLLMSEAADEYAPIAPEAIFRRRVNRAANAKDVNIEIGRRSLFGYLSQFPVAEQDALAMFTFDPANGGSGLMNLRISDRGAVIVSPRRVRSSSPSIILADIARAELAGGRAIFEVINGQNENVTAGLFVINNNKTLSEYLFDPFLTLNSRSQSSQYKGSFAGRQYGFIVGSNGCLGIQDNAYLEYVGLARNSAIDGGDNQCTISPSSVVKPRNASALIFDQSHNPLAVNPQVVFGTAAALFFASGVDGQAGRGNSHLHRFALHDDSLIVQPFGSYVLDVEGDVDVRGISAESSKIELLSLEVAPTGGSLFVNSAESIFPVRTFAQDANGNYYRYNSGSFLINGHFNLNNVTLVHTNENAEVIANDDVNSQPTYIGGETFTLLDNQNAQVDALNGPVDPLTSLEAILMRPKLSFINSRFMVLASAALTGVDILIPNLVTQAVNNEIGLKNYNEFLFGYNGFAVDNGQGRSLVLGTQIGSYAADGITVIGNDAHFDVIQTQDMTMSEVDPADPQGDQTVVLDVIANNDSIVAEIGDNDIEGQFSNNIIFLGNETNISIGTNANVTGFFADTHPWMRIAGDFFDFETAGGILQDPLTSVRTGTGAIFVDLNGKFSADPLVDVTINVTIARNYNGIVDLSLSNSLFNSLASVTNSEVNLNNLNNLVLVARDEHFAEYTLDWSLMNKDFLVRKLGSFVPYPITQNNLANFFTVTDANIANIPVIQGSVDQLQIMGSTLGLPVTFAVDGGNVGEIVFVGNQTGNVPVAIVVLKNGGTVGLGSTSRNSDSVFSSGNIGRNGITIIADGSGNVILNEDMYVRGVSPFLFGPNAQSGDTLTISSASGKAVVVTENSTLDLRGVTAGTTLQFANGANLLLNPRAAVLFGGGTLGFSNDAQMNFAPSARVNGFFDAIPFGPINNTLPVSQSVLANLPHNQNAPLIGYGQGLLNTDLFRTVFVGNGVIKFAGDSHMMLPKGAFLGIETLKQTIADGVVAEIPITDLELRVEDNARVQIGHEDVNLGGVLQIGNVQDLGANHSIKFVLTIEGSNAKFELGSQGALGLNAGVVKALKNNVDEMLFDTLFNVSSIVANVNTGMLDISRIWPTNDPRANIVVIGDDNSGVAKFNLHYPVFGDSVDTIAEVRAQNAVVAGGSPIAYIKAASVDDAAAGALVPYVHDQNGELALTIAGQEVVRPRYQAGMLASTALQDNSQEEMIKVASAFFNQIATQDAFIGFTPAHNKANAGTQGEEFRASQESIRLGTVSQGQIIRADIDDIFSGNGGDQAEIQQDVVEKGAAFISISESTNTISTVAQIPS